MQHKMMNINAIKSNPDNPRLIKDANFDRLVKSIKDAPWMLDIRPIVVDENMTILGGNMRYEACLKAGLKEVPIINASNLSEEQKKEFIIKDNLGYGEWDFEILCNQWDCDLLNDWGLEIPDFGAENLTIEEDDAAIEEPKNTDIVLGDLIEIGCHRLICGDSTNPDHVKKLLESSEPYLMVTDPPYGVEYSPEWRNDALSSKKNYVGRSLGKVENDDISDWSDAWSLSLSKVAYIYHAAIFGDIVKKSLVENDYEIKSQIIWNKNHFAIGRSHYHWKHEACWYAIKKGSEGKWIGGRDKTTVWDIDKNISNDSGHSTQKPIECMSRAIRNHEGDVYDPFLGSGTTMIASHQLNRKCYGIEINPIYCQIIVDRMLKLDPKLIVKINGKTKDMKNG